MDHVPQVKGLRVTQILEEARRHVDIDSYMPDLNYDKLPNRDFVINVGKTRRPLWLLVNILIPNELHEMIDRVMAENEDKYIMKRSLTMNVLPEFQRMFEDATQISSKVSWI